METRPKPPFSRYILILIYLAVGYAPLVPFVYFLTDNNWGGLYGNEAMAWVLIFSIFDILAIVSAARIFRAAPVYAVVSILLALVPLVWSWLGWIESGFGPSSKDDTNPYLGMIDFWLGGWGWITLFALVPLIIGYLFLRLKERTKSPSLKAA